MYSDGQQTFCLKQVDISEEETAHSASHYALTITEYVEFGDELVKVVASFGNGCQISLQQNIIVLLFRF